VQIAIQNGAASASQGLPMLADHINPFIAAVKNAFRTMLACEARRGGLSLKQDRRPRYFVSGVIGLSGKAVGTVVLNFSEQVALKAASAMLLMDMETLNEDVLDAVGELTNMVAGAAKAELEEYELQVSLPNVITGCDHEIHFPSNVVPLAISFDTEWGPFALEVGLAPVESLVEA
jgi:chemotaxis protein CheX